MQRRNCREVNCHVPFMCLRFRSCQLSAAQESGNCTSSGRILDLWAAVGSFTCCLLQDAFIFTVITTSNKL
ncbi:hypothetical protein NC652_023550 [Populus alba x Populus x berolinensis]|uniref:Uncharacterized protein n=1 Tax=Populus alba x Populus x berolinensis TaxID=444605 RepID=A0AAD6QCQ2_9ROSI|nr:hypothetical protein NC652_023550 [Populus alba x Populus x berolinensis]KAJ6985238.1 hypothetical protein NC653_023266 [Populus alba x Populus x berolinensis]